MAEIGAEAGEGGPLPKNIKLPTIDNRITELGGHPIKGRVKRLSYNLFTLVHTDKGYGVAKIGSSTSEELERFKNEAAMQRRAKRVWPHGNVHSIPAVHDSFTEVLPDNMGNLQRHPVIVTEYIPGGKNLYDVIRDEGGQGVQRGIRTMYPVALALDALRDAGIVHRDIKPKNIFMHHGVGLLADFGFAVDVGYKETGDRVEGTAGFFAPEHRRGEPLSNRTNTWGLAAVTFYAITGEMLMAPDTANEHTYFTSKKTYDSYIKERIKILPSASQNIFLKAVAFDPGERYDSSTRFMLDLEQAERDQQATTDIQERASRYKILKVLDGPRRRRVQHVPRHAKD